MICNKETKGKFESLNYFIGKVILTIGGGGDKIYIVEGITSLNKFRKGQNLKRSKIYSVSTKCESSNFIRIQDEQSKKQKQFHKQF